MEKESFLRPVMSYGNMFWYRPDALESLLNYERFKDDFPQEPLPAINTTAHAFEEVLIYVAWNQNFDFRIIINKEHTFSGFDVENTSGIDRIMNGNTWKIGRAIVWFPQQIKRIFDRIKMKKREV